MRLKSIEKLNKNGKRCAWKYGKYSKMQYYYCVETKFVIYLLHNLLETMINKYNHDDWKEFKRYFRIKNTDVANIIGINSDSVRNQTQPKNNLPKWATLAIWVWKKMLIKI